ncbi:hypothetical protein [Krasilnikovia sp. MM14-A1004]|uniref:hypothetical protein n=1 Tax=Krasilnikovia sp. MM14-A1004 TaxID=3373541 RepID=UPI00399D1FAA
MRHRAALLSAVPAVTAAAAFLALPTAASAAPGPGPGRGGEAEVRITEAPQTLTAGEDARTVTAVVTTDRGGGCRKVRWSAVLRAEGLRLDQVRVQRIEDDGDFPVQVQSAGDAARLTDVQFDPGELCRGKTVTARYRVAVDEDAPQGRVTLEVQAFDVGVRPLGAAVTTAAVQGGEADPEPSGSEDASPSPAPDESDDPGAGAADGDTTDPSASNPAAAAPPANNAASSSSDGSSGLLGPGLIVGALLVFAGVGLLLRLRTRNRLAAQQMQTQFYPAP